jgi:hypothetical protein
LQVKIKRKNKKYHAVGTVPKSNRQIVEKWKLYTPNTQIKEVITKLPNSEQSYKGRVETCKYINRQNQSTTGKL